MQKLFEILKILFFFLAVFLGLFFLRGSYLWESCFDKELESCVISNTETTINPEGEQIKECESNSSLCLISEQTYNLLIQILMPGFLILCGIMIGYVIATIWMVKSSTQGDNEISKIYTQSFIIGLVAGILLSLVYTFSG